MGDILISKAVGDRRLKSLTVTPHSSNPDGLLSGYFDLVYDFSEYEDNPSTGSELSRKGMSGRYPQVPWVEALAIMSANIVPKPK